MRAIVCDAGPVIHLHEAGLLALLQHCGTVSVPSLVHEEICANTDLEHRWPTWIRRIRLDDEAARQAAFLSRSGDLHGGEAEAFVLCEGIQADWLLTDDAAARLFASAFGLEVHGSLGVVLWNVARRHLTGKQGLAALEALARTSLWLSTRTLAEAREAINDICRQQRGNV
jgi:predicted nucleic acid-binding protein